MRKEYEYPQVSQIVGKYFIKLTRLSELIHQAYAGSNATEINFFIDLYSIKNSLLGKNFVIPQEYELCSLILDMVAFYKNYFRNIGVHATFYIVNSNNVPVDNKTFYPEYNSDFVIKMASGNTEWIDENLTILESLVEYFDDIYYYNTAFEAVAIIDTICTLSNKPSIILSKDPMCGMTVYNYPTCRVTWLRPRKYKGTDSSFICNSSNIMDNLIVECGLASGNFERPSPRLGPTELFAYTKFPARSIPQILSYRKFIHAYNLGEHISLSEVERNKVSIRSMVLDLIRQGTLYLNSSEYAENKNPSPKKYDIEGLKHINNYYFSGNPLMLDDLLR
jgi:hypothetical protein